MTVAQRLTLRLQGMHPRPTRTSSLPRHHKGLPSPSSSPHTPPWSPLPPHLSPPFHVVVGIFPSRIKIHSLTSYRQPHPSRPERAPRPPPPLYTYTPNLRSSPTQVASISTSPPSQRASPCLRPTRPRCMARLGININVSQPLLTRQI